MRKRVNKAWVRSVYAPAARTRELESRVDVEAALPLLRDGVVRVGRAHERR